MGLFSKQNSVETLNEMKMSISKFEFPKFIFNELLNTQSNKVLEKPSSRNSKIKNGV